MDVLRYLNRLKQEFWPSIPIEKTRLIDRSELKRSQEFEFRFVTWKNSTAGKELQKEFIRQIRLALNGLETSLDISIMDNSHSRGFYFNQGSLPDPETGVYLFEFLKYSVEKLGYGIKLKEQVFEEREGRIFHTERVHLKPKVDFHSKQFDQRFGNFIIERLEIDRIAGLLSLQNNFYTDRKYLKAQPFSEFIDRLEIEPPA